MNVLFEKALWKLPKIFNFLRNFKGFNLTMAYKINNCCHKSTTTQVHCSNNLFFLPFCVIRKFLHNIPVLPVDLFTPLFTLWASFAFHYFYLQNLNNTNVLLLCHTYFHPVNSPLVAP